MKIDQSPHCPGCGINLTAVRSSIVTAVPPPSLPQPSVPVPALYVPPSQSQTSLASPAVLARRESILRSRTTHLQRPVPAPSPPETIRCELRVWRVTYCRTIDDDTIIRTIPRKDGVVRTYLGTVILANQTFNGAESFIRDLRPQINPEDRPPAGTIQHLASSCDEKTGPALLPPDLDYIRTIKELINSFFKTGLDNRIHLVYEVYQDDEVYIQWIEKRTAEDEVEHQRFQESINQILADQEDDACQHRTANPAGEENKKDTEIELLKPVDQAAERVAEQTVEQASLSRKRSCTIMLDSEEPAPRDERVPVKKTSSYGLRSKGKGKGPAN